MQRGQNVKDSMRLRSLEDVFGYELVLYSDIAWEREADTKGFPGEAEE